MKNPSLYFTLLLSLSACSPRGFETLTSVADNATKNIACKNKALETQLWDGMKEYLLQERTVLEASSLKSAFAESFKKLKSENPQVSTTEFKKLESQMNTFLETVLVEAPAGERVASSDELLILISAMDVGDSSTQFRRYLQGKVRQQLGDLQKTIHSLDLSCGSNGSDTDTAAGGATPETPSLPDTGSVKTPPASSNPTPSPAPADPSNGSSAEVEQVVNKDYNFHKEQALKAGISLAAFGGRWTVATAYQSCQAVALPPMNERTPALQGVEIVGRHSDGVGNKRGIASLSKVIASHYYIKDMSNYGSGCFDVRKNPLIYDYGGKPYATTSSTSTIDLFKNNGSGTNVLGIDCSAFVYTSMASAGLRLKSGRPLKASDSWAWGSGSYVEPQQNGLTCLNKLTVTPVTSLKSGDIIAVYGHVLMVDQVGADPFGISKAKSSADCSSVTSANFNFSVSQSSPSKSSIGINIYEAKDYLPTSSKIKAGMEKYAYYACLAKVNNKNYTPNLGTLSVVRHKGTSDCVSDRVKLAQESCIASCGTLNR